MGGFFLGGYGGENEGSIPNLEKYATFFTEFANKKGHYCR